MRLFTGIELPEEVVGAIARLLERLRPQARIKWSPAGNLHITTKFIGEWPQERLDELRAVLASVPAEGALRIAIRQLGFFPNPRSPRVFWAGIDADPGLTALAAATERALEPLGIAAEQRPFSPHLTLARIKEPVPMQALRDTIAGLPSLDFGEFTASRFFLYQSRLAPSGSVYTKLAEFPLV